MKNLQDLVRSNIWALAPYSSARNEYAGHAAHIFLDANENPYNKPFNRYPDPLQLELKQEIAKIKKVKPEEIFLGNGSDEAIDLCFRVFCTPGKDNVVAIEPTYGMYKVCADINDVEYRPVLLDDNFQLQADRMLAAADENTKLMWLCSPNNPTGNNLDANEMERLVQTFQGIVVVDEAYSDFSKQKTFRERLAEFPNVIVLNTFSKAWGSAAIRLGMAFAQQPIIDLFNKVKYPYNVNLLTQKEGLEILKHRFDVEEWINRLVRERSRMMAAFRQLPLCEEVFPTNANFFLARVSDAEHIYQYLVQRGIIVRNRSKITLCGNCLRITIGSPSENTELLAALRQYQ